MSASQWVTVLVTGGVGVAGLALANSLKLKRRTELEVTAIAKRWVAYERFWSATKPAAPIRDVLDNNHQVLSEQARTDLHAALATWWFDEGGGMLLGEPTRTIYFAAKHNLVCPDAKLRPRSVATYVMDQPDRAIARSDLAIRQLSLLRTAMRADLGVIGRPYGKSLDPVDRAFLRSAGVRLWERPWSGGRRDRVVQRLSISRPEPLAPDAA